jgi:hypothetical protein
MSDLPEPLTPADSDLRSFPFMPLEVDRLRKSRAWLRAKRDPEIAFYLINLWTASWHELPAGSLEDDDEVLADRAMCEPKRWDRIKEKAMRGWVKCSDGRLYHATVAEKVHTAWEDKLAQRARTEAGREAKRKKRLLAEAQKTVTAPTETVTTSVTDIATGAATDLSHDPTVTVTVTGTITETSKEEITPKPPRGLRAKALTEDSDFATFYEAYPIHDAPDDALKAWRQVTKAGAKAAEIMAGLARYQFRTDPQFIKSPGGWLRAGCWKASAPSLPPSQPIDRFAHVGNGAANLFTPEFELEATPDEHGTYQSH